MLTLGRLTSLVCCIVAISPLPRTCGLDAAAWKQRTVYQVLTDRFALAQGASDTCDSGGCPYGNFCGGTFQGIVQHLDYIQGMGFDAIWISPVVDNIDCGYHGYWARHQFQIEQRFGGPKGLSALMGAAKQRGIAVMLDIVANHMGPPSSGNDYHEFTPFNSTDHYHGTLQSHCQAENAKDDQTREVCWLANLGDLKQENEFVSQQLVAWMQGLQKQYAFDAVRIDTVPYVGRPFWHTMQSQALRGTYSVGEVLCDDGSLPFLSSYQTAKGSEGYSGPLLDGVLNYPLFFSLRSALQQGQGGIAGILSTVKDIQSNFADPGALGNFVENHDQPRWLLGNKDTSTYKNGLVAAFFLPGVPIAYYGTEQGMAGGESDNDKREPLWRHGGYDTNAPLYTWTALVVQARKAMLKSLKPEDIDTVARLVQTGEALSFERGAALVIVAGKGAPSSVTIQTSWNNAKLCDTLSVGESHPPTANESSPVASNAPAVGHRTVAACNPTAQRSDCGHDGSTNASCIAKGCCWAPVNPNPQNLPWCFHSSSPPPTPPPPPPPSPPSPPPPGPQCFSTDGNGGVTVPLQGLPRVLLLASSAATAHRGPPSETHTAGMVAKPTERQSGPRTS